MSNISDDSSAAVVELLAPDGYYTYLGVAKPSTPAAVNGEKTAVDGVLDEEAVKKNYRKLSLRHHPDKGGDADTFRLLNRAQKVLMDPKLRKQYDILGIDLDDDDEHHHHDENDDASKETSSSQGIVQEIAGAVLTGVIQFGVRTRK